MRAKTKLNANYFYGVLVFIAFLLITISIPLVSYAQTGTLGQEAPEIYCTYEQDGVAVDGNNLTAGTYDVSFVMSGVESLSVVEITANYNQEKITVDSASSLISDTNAELDSMGYVLSDGNIVFGFVSENEGTTVLNDENVVLATVQMTFTEDCDAEEYLTVSENPNLTFAQVDYGDGYDDSYALTDNFEGYTGNLHPMGCDVTPAYCNSINGEIVIMIDSNGSTAGTPVYGTYTIDVYEDSERTILVDSVTTISQIDENNLTKNVFNISLRNGTYYATISSEYSIPRNVEIVVSDSPIYAVIPMICCDYDENGYMSSNDAKAVFSAVSTGEKSNYCDLDGNGYVSSNDAKIVFSFISGGIEYNSLVIE